MDLRREIYAHLQRLHVAFFDQNPVGRLMTRVTTDVDAVNELFTSSKGISPRSNSRTMRSSEASCVSKLLLLASAVFFISIPTNRLKQFPNYEHQRPTSFQQI